MKELDRLAAGLHVARLKAEPEAPQKLPDRQIDTPDIPELLSWTGARRGLLCRPVEHQVLCRRQVERRNKEKNR